MFEIKCAVRMEWGHFMPTPIYESVCAQECLHTYIACVILCTSTLFGALTKIVLLQDNKIHRIH